MFKAGGKMFCAFEVFGGRPSIAFRLEKKEAAAALKDVRCFASPYGRGLWVSVWVDEAVDWKQISSFVERSYMTVEPNVPFRLKAEATESKGTKSRRFRLQAEE